MLLLPAFTGSPGVIAGSYSKKYMAPLVWRGGASSVQQYSPVGAPVMVACEVGRGLWENKMFMMNWHNEVRITCVQRKCTVEFIVNHARQYYFDTIAAWIKRNIYMHRNLGQTKSNSTPTVRCLASFVHILTSHLTTFHCCHNPLHFSIADWCPICRSHSDPVGCSWFQTTQCDTSGGPSHNPLILWSHHWGSSKVLSLIANYIITIATLFIYSTNYDMVCIAS